MVPSEFFGTISYSHSIVTAALSCVVSEINRDICRKSRFFHIPCLHSTPPLGGPRRNVAIPFDTEKLGWWLSDGKKFDMFSRFEIIPACDGRTDRQTSCDSIAR